MRISIPASVGSTTQYGIHQPKFHSPQLGYDTLPWPPALAAIGLNERPVGSFLSMNSSESLTDEHAANCKAAAEYSHSQNGTGVLVMVRGEIIFEDYAPGWNADKPHLLASGTKSFCGIMAVCAAHDGLLTLDEKVADTLT